ncbi:MAG: AMP phosphorylase [Candidatus Micrarchaeota archaeon]
MGVCDMIAKEYRCKVKCFDVTTGQDIVVLNKERAIEEDIYISDRVIVTHGDVEVTCIVDLSNVLVQPDEVGLFQESAEKLGVKPGNEVTICHARYPVSVDYIKKKMDGKELTSEEINTIIREAMENRLSDVELASLLTTMYIRELSIDETVALTNAVVSTGSQLNLEVHPIVDKHCSGGVAGNRTTMVVVPIIAAAGLYIPKTSSRSITSASGTADTMEVLASVKFSIDEMKEIVLKHHGCIVWGGAINLATVDDKLIKIRHPLRLDPKGVLLASILAKKKSVGAEYVVIDIPVGRGSKIENVDDAKSLAKDFVNVGKRLGMTIECFISDGTDPIGKGIGPALECADVLRVLQNDGPTDLKDKSLQLAGEILELCGKVPKGRGINVAEDILRSGKAYQKMIEIIEAQGGDPKITPETLPIGTKKHAVIADKDGRVQHVDNRLINKIARAAGAPKNHGAGVLLHCEHGDKVARGDVLFEIIAEHESKLEFALKTLETANPIELERVIIGKYAGDGYFSKY